MNKVRSLFAGIGFLMLSFSTPEATAFASPAGSTDSTALSFDMWCLEMQVYPTERCNVRRSEDLKAYERYRTSVEQFQQQKAAREKRDLELRQKLNRDPIGAGQQRDATAK